MQALIRELTRLERPALEAHFLALGASERRLRFGVPLSDSAVRTYVERIDFERDAVFGVSGEDLRLAGVGHVGRGDGHAELGISVLESERGRGIGGALLARRQGMAIVTEAGESDAWLKLPPADAGSHFGEVFEQRVALFDHALKQGRAWLGRGK